MTDGPSIETTARIRSIHPLDALTRVIHGLRPDWPVDRIRAALATDLRADTVAVPAAVACALDPNVRQPGALRTYKVDEPASAVDFPRAPKCPHGVLADPDGRGAGCDGCGTRAVPPPPGLADTLRRTA